MTVTDSATDGPPATPGLLARFLAGAGRRGDVVFASLFVLVVGMLILPMPTLLMDTLLAVNFGLTLVVLLSAIYLRNTLDLSAFPAILLVTTVFRLALTVSTSRLILAQGDAGAIVSGFGRFVVAGNVVVGLVVFAVVAIVQFIVITKGAERVAEVGARFTLDALPGKQMSIDSDFRNGEITKEEARQRRFVLERESQFFGAMDGAMRFVKGDAIASMLVVVVNLVGGLLIGTLQRGMPLREAAQLYALLTVGDGLVAQIPAMFMAVAAGTLVTRVASEERGNLGSDLSRQLAAQPQALGVAGAFMALMGLVPGFPAGVFLTLGAGMGGLAFALTRTRAAALARAKEATAAAAAPPAARLREPGMNDLLVLSIAPSLEQPLLAAGLAAAVQARAGMMARRLGFTVPMPGLVADGRLIGALRLEVDGVAAFEMPLDPAALGQQVHEIADQVAEYQRRYAARLFGLEEAGAWLDEARADLGRLVADVQQQVPMLRLVDTLRRLLDEEVPIVQRRTILEALLQFSGETNPDTLCEGLRGVLQRQISHRHTGLDGHIAAIVAGPDVEDFVRRAATGNTLPADEGVSAGLVRQTRAIQATQMREGRHPVVLAPAPVRRWLRQFLASQGVVIPVLAYSEIAAETQVRAIATLSTRATDAAAAA
jgi:type III secretion protein V